MLIETFLHETTDPDIHRARGNMRALHAGWAGREREREKIEK
jgi:hypothetical protein